MPDITSQEAITFVAQNVRPFAERLRALFYEMKDHRAEWLAGVGAEIPNTSDPIREDRADGIPNLTGAEVNSIISFIASELVLLDTPAAAQLMARAAVRPLHAT